MKSLNIHFKVAGYCSMNVEVPDEYQIPSTNPRVFWEDLYETFPDKIETNILNCENIGVEFHDFGGFYMDQMVLDSIQRVFVHQEMKIEDKRIDFDPMSFDSSPSVLPSNDVNI